MKKGVLITLLVVIVGAAIWWYFCPQKQDEQVQQQPAATVTTTKGNPDIIRLESPRPEEQISSPLTITGEARGNWFFEASFPVSLVNWDGLIIAQGIATAKIDPDANDGAGWMTADFVPFEATLTFTVDKDVYSRRGALILQKDNPSGLPEHDDALEIPINFK